MSRRAEELRDEFEATLKTIEKNMGGRENFFDRKEPLPLQVIKFLRELDQDDPLWAIFRGKNLFLGGSSIGAFIGVGKYNSVQECHSNLRAEDPEGVDNVYTRFGHFGEDSAGILSKRSLCDLGQVDPRHVSVNTIGTCVHSRVPFLAVSLDVTYSSLKPPPKDAPEGAGPERVYIKTEQICDFLGNAKGLDMDLVVGELKCPSSKSGQGVSEVPSDYMAQTQFEIFTARYMRDPAFDKREYAVLSILCCDIARVNRTAMRVTLGNGPWVLKQWLIKYDPAFMKWAADRVLFSTELYKGLISDAEFPHIPDRKIPEPIMPPNIRLPNYYVVYTGEKEVNLSLPRDQLEDVKASFNPDISPENFRPLYATQEERLKRHNADLLQELSA